MTNMANILNKENIEEYYHEKSAPALNTPLTQLDLDIEAQDRAQKSKKTWIAPQISLNCAREPSSPQNILEKLDLCDEAIDNAMKAKKNAEPLSLQISSYPVQQKRSVLLKELMDNYSKNKVTPKILCSIADMLCEQFSFLYIEGMALYVYTEEYYHLFTYAYAGPFLRKAFLQNEIKYAFRTVDYKEIVNQLKARERITVCPDDCRTNVDIVLFSDGAFNVLNGAMQPPFREDYQFSKINFPLCWGKTAIPTPDAEDFIQRFCSFNEKKEIYLWELIGYLLSSYQEKIMVVFYGPSNSGKSTLANFIQRIVGTKNCVSMGIRDLSGTFNLAELQGKRLCVDSEMDATTLRERDISILKKVVGNDYIQGNRKHEQQFYFQCQAKLLICTNNKIAIRSDGDSIPLLNRIRGFQLQESISPEAQCHNMDQILDENRTYFLQRAMEGLQDLVRNNFEFSYIEPAEDFVKNTSPFANTASVREFVDTCCISENGLHEPVGTLYDAYVEYAGANSWRYLTKNHFSRTLCEECGFTRQKVQGTRCILNLQLKQ